MQSMFLKFLPTTGPGAQANGRYLRIGGKQHGLY